MLRNSNRWILPDESARSTRHLRISLDPIERQFHFAPSRLVLLFERLYLFHATAVARCVAEVSGKEALDQFPGER